jgi:hypothetical protein
MSFFAYLAYQRRNSCHEGALSGGDINFSFRPSHVIIDVTTGKISQQIDNLPTSANTSIFFCNNECGSTAFQGNADDSHITFVHRP